MVSVCSVVVEVRRARCLMRVDGWGRGSCVVFFCAEARGVLATRLCLRFAMHTWRLIFMGIVIFSAVQNSEMCLLLVCRSYRCL